MPSDAVEKALTPRQRRFVAEFLASGNATESARKAGYSPKVAHSVGYRMIRRHPAVQAAIVEAEADRLAELRVTADRLDARLARIAFAETAEDLAVLGCSGRDQLAAVKLLLERAGLLEQRHVIESRGRVGLYSAGRPGQPDDGGAVDLDDPTADATTVVVMLPKNGRDPGT